MRLLRATLWKSWVDIRVERSGFVALLVGEEVARDGEGLSQVSERVVVSRFPMILELGRVVRIRGGA